METTPGRPSVAASAGAYALLFVLGMMVGLIGCFQYSRSVGAAPVAALAADVVVLAICVLAGRGMGSAVGGLAVAMGWLAASLALTLPTAGGSVIVTNTAAGKWYLYGGAACAAIGVVLGARARSGRRPSPGGGPRGASADSPR